MEELVSYKEKNPEGTEEGINSEVNSIPEE